MILIISNERISHYLEEKGVDSIEGSLIRELDS
jgi:hypothetical protein